MALPCLTVSGCLEYRRAAFAPNPNLILDSWDIRKCGLCIVGSAREEDAARNRPPECAKCGREVGKGSKSMLCLRCSKIRTSSLGRKCDRCNQPISDKYSGKVCYRCYWSDRPEAKKERTHCIRGHSLSDENKMIDRFGHIRCRICNRENAAKQHHRRKRHRKYRGT